MNWYVLIRFGELGLKGKNRSFFENTLRDNLHHARRGIAACPITKLRGRLLAGPVDQAPHKLARALATVFGVASVSITRKVAGEIPLIEQAALALTADWLADHPGTTRISFKVEVRRADKSFPKPSMEMARDLGATLLLANPRLQVKVKNPELLVEADIRTEGTFVYAGRIQGPGGLPVGTQGLGLLLLSGGIDSPVAGWLAMKRGLRLQAIHFESSPYTGAQSLQKVKDLAAVLTTWGAPVKLHVVPFTGYQEAIKEACSARYHTVLFRLGMHRIAQLIADREGAKALVTGEALGQVASQTIENLALVDGIMKIPVLRPLITYDKQEAISIAEKIGTFDISIRPFPDCCTVFTPKRPIIKGKPEVAAAEESRFPGAELLAKAVAETVTLLPS